MVVAVADSGAARMAGALRNRPLAAYALAAGLALVALFVRLAIGDRFPPGFPFLTFFPAIIVTSYVAGARAGTLCALLSLLVAWYFFVPPLHSLALEAGTIMALAFFIGVAGIDIALIDAMQRALDRLSTERRLTAQLYEQQRTLFQELQHRVANNLAFVSSLLRLRQRTVEADPATAPQAIEDAIARIDTMGRIHRQLYDPRAAGAEPALHLQQLCDDLIASSGRADITAHVSMPGARFAIDRLLPLSLLVSELVTNSLKHGFNGRSGGALDVHLEPDGAGGEVLVVRDDGAGLPDGHDPLRGNGLGMKIIRSLAGQLNGSISMVNQGGTVARIHLPLRTAKAAA